jgi:hypothetical protein
MEVWGDPDFENYSPEQKLIFLYLITNNLTRESGIYPITLRRISNDTGIRLQTVVKQLSNGLQTVSEPLSNRLKNIYYDKNIVFVQNFRKYNSGGRPDFIKKAVLSDFINTQSSYLWRLFDEIYPEFELKNKFDKTEPFPNGCRTVVKPFANRSQTVVEPLSNRLQTGTENVALLQGNVLQGNVLQDIKTNVRSDSLSADPYGQVLAGYESAGKVEIMTIPLVGQEGVFAVTWEYVEQLQESFPGVDIMQQLREYRQWAYDKPKKRKTRGGIRRSISSWMGKEQDKGGIPPPPPPSNLHIGDRPPLVKKTPEEEELFKLHQKKMFSRDEDEPDLTPEEQIRLDELEQKTKPEKKEKYSGKPF